MHHTEEYKNHDELRGRFTVWLEKVVKNAKINYIERLAEAFSKLPLMRKRILTMLFVENISPDKISKNLNCSPQYVYNQRYKALKALRNELDKDGEQS